MTSNILLCTTTPSLYSISAISATQVLRLVVQECTGVCVCVCTLPCDYNTSHAVWDAGACCQEGDAHDDVRDAESEANHGHLKTKRNKEFVSIYCCLLIPYSIAQQYKQLYKDYNCELQSQLESIFSSIRVLSTLSIQHVRNSFLIQSCTKCNSPLHV